MYYEYSHGGNIYDESGNRDEGLIDFSSSINPLGMSEEVIAAAAGAVRQANVYPDPFCRLLRAELAEFEGIDRTYIFCGNGASDILFRLNFVLKPRKILVTAPAFSDYERAGRAAGAEVIYYRLKEENGFKIGKDITEVIGAEQPEIVFICNPNNPTAGLTETSGIESIAEACKKSSAMLAVDECFLDFVYEHEKYSAKKLIKRYKNIILVKAFTKIFAMPGLRLGYVLCSDETLIERLRFCGADWAVSNIAQAAGIAALRNSGKYIRDTALYITKERKYITGELEALGLRVYPSYANFIFFRCPNGIDLYAELYRKGIVIRDCSDFIGLGKGYYRIGISSEKNNRRLAETLGGLKNLWQSL